MIPAGTITRLSAQALQGGAPVYWLLEFTFAGRTWRLSDGPQEVTTIDGESIRFHPGLDTVEHVESIDLLADSTTQAVAVSLAFDLGASVADLVARGHELAGSRGVLSRWVEGTAYEHRRVVLAGVAVDPEYGADDEPVSLTLEASPWTDASLFPGEALSVVEGNIPTAWYDSLGEGEHGLAYPQVYGRPGRLPERPVAAWGTVVTARGWSAGSQGVWLWHESEGAPPAIGGAGYRIKLVLCIAGHWSTATTVYLSSESYPGGAIFRCYNGWDEREHPITYVPWYCTVSGTDEPYDYDAGGTYSYSDTVAGLDVWGLGHTTWTTDPYQPDDQTTAEPIYVGWLDHESDGGGKVGEDGTLMRGAGKVLADLLRQTSVPVDRGRWAAVEGFLDRYRLDFVIDAQVVPWDFARQNILPLLPVSIVTGPEGLYGVVWRYDATTADAVAHLDTGTDPEIERTGPVTTDRSEVVNRITVKYGRALRTGRWLAQVTLDATDDNGAIPDLYCATSQLRYRRVDGSPLVVEKTIEAVCIYDDATALAVAQWYARAFALARCRVTYSVSESRYGWLERGAVVTLTDADLYIDGRVCIVESIAMDGSGRLEMGLLMVADPVRDALRFTT